MPFLSWSGCLLWNYVDCPVDLLCCVALVLGLHSHSICTPCGHWDGAMFYSLFWDPGSTVLHHAENIVTCEYVWEFVLLRVGVERVSWRANLLYSSNAQTVMTSWWLMIEVENIQKAGVYASWDFYASLFTVFPFPTTPLFLGSLGVGCRRKPLNHR